MIVNSPEELNIRMNSGSREEQLSAVNAVLSGNVVINQEQKKANVPNVQTVSEQDQKIDSVLPITENKEEIITPVVSIDEYEQQKKYAEFLEQKEREEHLRHLAELKEREDALLKERASKEELEKRLRELDQIRNAAPTVTSEQISEEEDENYVSDYAKKTRAMIEEFKATVGEGNALKELREKISKIETDYDQQKKLTLELQQKEKQEEIERKTFDNIRKFQSEHPELQTEVDIVDIDKQYSVFRKNIAHLIKANSTADVDKAIESYNSNGEIKKLADERGIKGVKDFNKYKAIAELIDLKNGVKYDSITGKEIPILDDEGKQVRYRSLDEVYKIKNFYDELNNIRKQTYKEVSRKLEGFENAPVTLPQEKTSTFSSGFTAEQESEILNWNPKNWENSPEKFEMVKKVYNKRGLDVPQYRGRKY